MPVAGGEVPHSRTFEWRTVGAAVVLSEDGVELEPARLGSTAALVLLERLNQLACFATPALTVHSGLAADEEGRGVWIAAASGGGKSTLTAQLALSGLRYATDEAVTVSTDGHLSGWARWLCLKRGSQQVLRRLAPDVDDPIEGDGRWMVPPDALGAVERRAVVPGVVAFPRHRPGAVTSVEPISRAAAVAEIVPQVFNLRRHGAEGIDALVAAVRRAHACVRVTYGDGWDAASELAGLLQAAPTAGVDAAGVS